MFESDEEQVQWLIAKNKHSTYHLNYRIKSSRVYKYINLTITKKNQLNQLKHYQKF